MRRVPLIVGVLLACAVATASGQIAPTPAPPGPDAAAIDNRVFIVGDSIILGARPAIAARLGSVGWVVYHTSIESLHTWQAAPIVDANLAHGGVGEVAFVELGANDGSDPAQLAAEIDLLMYHLRGVRRVYWINMRYFRDWVPAANAEIMAAASRWVNLRVVDWDARSTNDPALVYGDGIHLNPSGQAAMADLLATTLDAWIAERTAPTTTTTTVTTVPRTLPGVAAPPSSTARSGGTSGSVQLAAGVGALLMVGATAGAAARAGVRRRRRPCG